MTPPPAAARRGSLVSPVRFELTTFGTQNQRATRLRYGLTGTGAATRAA